ncbi:hypothetical protein [Nonomuraea lactucae]|uniref:hypothetical protein n=1 Tax=Nonomuraea lactucae TaxID=2249762 RepID=UPI000DE3EBD6|nr:hypothetical protein [Nonomuraea lactucae]
MSEGYPTAAKKEALRIVCDTEPIPIDRLADELLATRRPSSNPGYPRAITRMAGTLAWRLHAQGFIAEAAGRSESTADGRDLIASAGRDK